MKNVIIIIIIDKNIYEYIYVNFLHNYSTSIFSYFLFEIILKRIYIL